MKFPNVAGSYYPSDRVALSHTVTEMLAEAAANDYGTHRGVLRALIVPHAGYIHSGSVAAFAYHCLLNELRKRPRPDLSLVIVAPAHNAKYIGTITARFSHYRTPLGDVAIKALPGLFAAPPRVFDGEHSLEVQLPFLQTVCAKNEFTVLPLLVGNTEPERLEHLLAGPITASNSIVIVTSDLSHFLTPPAATTADIAVCRALERMEFGTIESAELCGKTGVLALTRLANRLGLAIQCLKYGQSMVGDGVAGAAVGYGAFALFATDGE